jgi:integrase
MASLKKRGKSYQIQYCVAGRQRRVGLGPIPLQIAKEKLRQFESARLRGEDVPLPTRTPIAEVVTAYVAHIRSVKTPKSAQTDVYYLREAFGPICPALEITSRRVTEACRKRPRRPGQDRRARVPTVEPPYLEAITTADVAAFISAHTRARGLAPKTANRYREIIVRLFNWAMKQYGVRMPRDKNPAAAVERYKEPAPEIRYLSLAQIDEQLEALSGQPQLQTMVAVLIYAGLRRAELLWLTRDDVSLPRGRPGLAQVRAKTLNGQAWQPKTRTNRAVPISTYLRVYLDAYTARPSIGRWFFPSPKGTRWEEDNFSADLRAANRVAALPWACLDFRHTFGTHLAQKGVSLYKIAELMGNSPDVCRRHYAGIHTSNMEHEVEFVRDRGTV